MSNDRITDPAIDAMIEFLSGIAGGSRAATMLTNMKAEREELLALIGLVGAQFKFYEQQHLATDPPDINKARTNRFYAEMCAAKLSVTKGG